MPIALAAPLLSAALTLRVPFAPDGSVAGCPHAHALRMALELKGVPYDIAPLDSAALPCSLEAPGGDALDIAALDAMHPEPPLGTAAAASACAAAASLLSAIERYLLSTADVERAHAVLKPRQHALQREHAVSGRPPHARVQVRGWGQSLFLAAFLVQPLQAGFFPDLSPRKDTVLCCS